MLGVLLSCAVKRSRMFQSLDSSTSDLHEAGALRCAGEEEATPLKQM